MSDDGENENENEERINIMTLGNTEVGKSCFILRFTDNIFQEIYLATVGIDFKIKTETINNKQYKLFFIEMGCMLYSSNIERLKLSLSTLCLVIRYFYTIQPVKKNINQ